MDNKNRAAEVIERKTLSANWMRSNFYDQWEQVFKSYYCERDPEKDQTGADDPTQTSIGMPDMYAFSRRTVARCTAQSPNLRFHAKDRNAAELINRTLMYQWDRGGVQRQQKKHVLQSVLFGWSVRAWFWQTDRHIRRKRIDPFTDPDTPAAISRTYGVPPETFQDPNAAQMKIAELLSQYGRGGLLPIEYTYTSYSGPGSEWVFVGDVYPEPNFQSIQTSNWFQVERRRNIDWIKRVVKRFPEFQDGFSELLSRYPGGTVENGTTLTGGNSQSLRSMLTSTIGRSDTWEQMSQNNKQSKEWLITEEHIPGPEPKLRMVGKDDIWIGEIPYPYDLDGRIAFTELLLIDNLLAGVGDSTCRIIRGLQQLRDRLSNVRADMVYNLSRPLIGTTDISLYENPDLLKRHQGFRLVYMRGGPNSLWSQPEQAAMAATATALNDDSAMMRNFQMATGESNMSMASNVDPQQGRTATGARIMAYNQDILTKDMLAMIDLSIADDANMMFLLNRSEMDDKVEFESSRYNRDFMAEQDAIKEQWTQVGPSLFQIDGEITPEPTSTLADDDEAKVGKAMMLWQIGSARPDLFNVQALRDEVLIAHGKGANLAQYVAPPQPPPDPPLKASLTISTKMEMLPPEVQAKILQEAGIQIVPPPPGAPGPPPPPGGPGVPPPAMGTPAAVPIPPPPDQNVAAGAYAAAKGAPPRA